LAAEIDYEGEGVWAVCGQILIEPLIEICLGDEGNKELIG
jgi:hypothetical protein